MTTKRKNRDGMEKGAFRDGKPEFDAGGIPRGMLEHWRGRFGKDVLDFIDGKAEDLDPEPGGLQYNVQVCVSMFTQSVEAQQATMADGGFPKNTGGDLKEARGKSGGSGVRNYPMLRIRPVSEVAWSYFFKRDGMGNPVYFNPDFSKLMIEIAGDAYIEKYKASLRKSSSQVAKDTLREIKKLEKDESSNIDDELFKRADKGMENCVGDYFRNETEYGRLYQRFEKHLGRGNTTYRCVPVGTGGKGWYLDGCHPYEYKGGSDVLIAAAKAVDVQWPSAVKLAEIREARRGMRLVFDEKTRTYKREPRQSPKWRLRNGEEDLFLKKILSTAGAALRTNKFCLCAVECQPSLVTPAEYDELRHEDDFYASKTVSGDAVDTVAAVDDGGGIRADLVRRLARSFDRGNDGNGAAERHEAIVEYLVKAHQSDAASTKDLQGDPGDYQRFLDRIEAGLNEIDAMPEPQRTQKIVKVLKNSNDSRKDFP